LFSVISDPKSKFIAQKIVKTVNDCRLRNLPAEKIVLTKKVFNDLSHDEDYFAGFDISDNQEYLFGVNVCVVSDGRCQVIAPTQFGRQTFDIQCSKKDFFVHTIRQNLYVRTISRSGAVSNVSPAEERAIELLREMITEAEFRRYLKYGFILVQAQSSRIYQVFREARHIKVWLNGKCIEEICVRLNELPQTDYVVAFKVMIETDEIEFRQLGNLYRLAAS